MGWSNPLPAANSRRRLPLSAVAPRDSLLSRFRRGLAPGGCG